MFLSRPFIRSYVLLIRNTCSQEIYHERRRRTTDYYHDWFGGIEPLYVVELFRSSPVDPHFCGQQWSTAGLVIQFAAGAHDDHPVRHVDPALNTSICCQINRTALMLLSTFCSVLHTMLRMDCVLYTAIQAHFALNPCKWFAGCFGAIYLAFATYVGLLAGKYGRRY